MGYERGEVIGRIPNFFLTETSLKHFQEVTFKQFLQTGIAKDVQYQFIKKNGDIIDVLLFAAVEQDAAGDMLQGLAVSIDITQHVQTEQMLLQSSRLVALGQMAAGMAHELNQPLTVISARAEWLKMRLEQNKEINREQQLEWSRHILEQVERMTHIIEHLRLFSRDCSQEPQTQVDINDVVHSARGMVDAQLKSHGIEIKTELAKELPQVLGDLFRLEQVLLNLLVNARDALNDQETTLTDQERSTWEKSLHIRTQYDLAKEQVILEVEDAGTGIRPEDQRHLFEPFFTTKAPDKGTGLGLSLSYAIVKDHKGEIECKSRPGECTLFRIRLPAVANAPT